MEIRLTIEIDGKKYHMKYEDAEKISSYELGKVVQYTIDRHCGQVMPAQMPVEVKRG